MRLGIFGGTFDPIHNAHLRMAIEAYEQLKLDELVFEVSKASPLKQSQPKGSLELRRELVQLAITPFSSFQLGDFESTAPAPSYTISTLRHYQSSEREIWLIIGSDQLLQFREWREPESILEIARLAVAPRGGVLFQQALHSTNDSWPARIDEVLMDRLDISSTIVREKLSKGKSVRGLLPESVADCIDRKKLYQ